MVHKDFIVAIELGSSKITAIAGRKNADGSITVLGMVKEDSTSFIRNGIVYKIDKTVQCISNLINKLQANLKTQITKVYVGVGGQSIHSERNVIVKRLPELEVITHEMIDEIQETNRQMNYSGQFILDSITQEFKVDQLQQTDPIGIQCHNLEANYLNILCREQFYENLNDCFQKANIPIAEMLLSPIALADAILLDSEKRSGCVLVDLGSDTTTVAVYHKNILRHLAVIPLGGINITRDIASQHIEENVAERLKLTYGSAYSELSETDEMIHFSEDGNDDKTISKVLFNDIVEARMREIIENVNAQIPKMYRDNLLGGMIITGGGCNMPDIEKAFTTYTSVQKVRIAKFIQPTINSRLQDISSRNAMMNTVLALLTKGYMNCAGDEYNPNEKLFDNKGEATINVEEPMQFDVAPAAQPKREGVAFSIPTPEEREAMRQRQEEEDAKHRAEEELIIAPPQEEQSASESELEAKPESEKKDTPAKKIMRWINNLIKEED